MIRVLMMCAALMACKAPNAQEPREILLSYAMVDGSFRYDVVRDRAGQPMRFASEEEAIAMAKTLQERGEFKLKHPSVRKVLPIVRSVDDAGRPKEVSPEQWARMSDWRRETIKKYVAEGYTVEAPQ